MESYQNKRLIKMEDRKKMVIACAKDLFIKQGLSQVSMQNIMEASGIGKATMYRYYENVHQIAVEVQVQMLKEIYSDLKPLVIGTAHNPMEAVLETLIKNFYQHRDAYRFIGTFDFLYGENYGNEQAGQMYEEQLKALFDQHVAVQLDKKTKERLLLILGMVSSYLQKLALREDVYDKSEWAVADRLETLRQLVKGWVV
ncbi:TetR/AcrR family transcriptional regulator [Fusibacter bizertensis]